MMDIIAQVKLSGVTPIDSIDQITPGCRLFYELGEYDEYGTWRLSGVFKEVKDVERMRSCDEGLLNPGYFKHHNFVIIP